MTWPCRGKRPWVYGHRGVRDSVPENTMPAFELALRRGADGVEFDVQVSADGEAIVFHDSTLERMTEGRDCRTVPRLSVQELRSVSLGPGAPIPTLEDVLLWANVNQVYLNIELKCGGSDLTTLLIAVEKDISGFASTALQDRIVISSFSREAISLVNSLGWPWISAQLFDRDEPFNVASSASIGAHPHHSLLSGAEALPSSRSYFVNAWTVNDSETTRRLDGWGVDGIITDEIERVLEALNRPEEPI